VCPLEVRENSELKRGQWRTVIRQSAGSKAKCSYRHSGPVAQGSVTTVHGAY
jgi:hypothetical protein